MRRNTGRLLKTVNDLGVDLGIGKVVIKDPESVSFSVQPVKTKTVELSQKEILCCTLATD